MGLLARTIYLVGAGPGDPDLLTVKARDTIYRADVIMHDSVVSKEILGIARNARYVDAGLAGYSNIEHQRKLAKELVGFLGEGAVVCRLKSGDPFLFGNGGETLRFLKEELGSAGRVEIIPGISSGLGATSVIGLPLTYSGIGKSVSIISGHNDGTPLDYDSMVSVGTLVFYMSLLTMNDHVAGLIEAGFSTETPVCIIEKGCHVRQRVFVTNLRHVIEKLIKESVSEPVIFVVGRCVDRYSELTNM